MGWLWLLLGGFWSLFAFLSLIVPPPVETADVTVSRFAWWEEAIGDTFEGGFFVAMALCGIALLRRWRWSRITVWVQSPLWLLFSSLFFTPAATGTLTMAVFWFGPSLALALYSLIVLWLTRRVPVDT